MSKETVSSNPIHIMLDLETLGTKPGCKILAIGATVFGGDSRVKYEDFEIYISRYCQGHLIEESSTLLWWKQQSAEARAAVFERESAIILENAMFAFSEWILDVTETAGVKSHPVVWGNAASFDCEILAYAYRHFGVEPPWNFRNQMCYRTFKNLFPEIKPDEFQGVKHTPLADTQYQAAHAEKIAKTLRVTL